MTEVPYFTDKESPLVHHVSLCELLDRVLNKGAVLSGELTISVADIELLYIGIGLVISSVETLIDAMGGHQTGREQTGETP